MILYSVDVCLSVDLSRGLLIRQMAPRCGYYYITVATCCRRTRVSSEMTRYVSSEI